MRHQKGIFGDDYMLDLEKQMQEDGDNDSDENKQNKLA